MRIACWIIKATNTHLEYVILSAFPLQHWLHERFSMLRYTYIACLVGCTERTEYFSVVAVNACLLVLVNVVAVNAFLLVLVKHRNSHNI